jgi:hypothetical protein
VLLIYLSGHPVVGVGEVDSRGAHLVELLTVPWGGVGQVDDVEDLGPPKRVICTARMSATLGQKRLDTPCDPPAVTTPMMQCAPGRMGERFSTISRGRRGSARANVGGSVLMEIPAPGQQH